MKSSKLKIAVAVAVVVGVVAPVAVSAAADSKTTTINAEIGSTISMTTPAAVNINVTPGASASQSNATDTVTVATNNSSGYTLTLSDADAATTLTNGASSIPAHSGTLTTPTALAVNTWGYHVANIGGFGTVVAPPESNVATSATKYAGISPLASPALIRTTLTNVASEATTISYAVRVDASKTSGTYSDTVTYTATTRP